MHCVSGKMCAAHDVGDHLLALLGAKVPELGPQELQLFYGTKYRGCIDLKQSTSKVRISLSEIS